MRMNLVAPKPIEVSNETVEKETEGKKRKKKSGGNRSEEKSFDKRVQTLSKSTNASNHAKTLHK